MGGQAVVEIEAHRHERVERRTELGDSECRFSRRTFIISACVLYTFERGPLFDDKRRVDESSIGSKVARVVDHSCNSLTRVVRTKLLLHLAPPTLSRSLGVRRNYTP